jgi:ribosomal protein S18 acetylase RimI-like enzyme
MPRQANDLIIRSCRVEDEEATAALWREVFPITHPRHEPVGDIRRKLAVSDDLLLVGVVSGRVVATTMVGYDGHRGWIYRVAVAPTLRRQGIGRAMLTAAEAHLRRIGCPKINLQIEGSNHRVVGFYERLGFAVEDRISMGKALG